MSIRTLAAIALCVGLIFGIAIGKDRPRDRSESGHPVSANQAAIRRIEKALASTHSYRFEEVPLREVLDKIAEDKQISIWVDQKELADCGISTEQRVTLKVKPTPLRHVLTSLLGPLTLTYLVEDGVLKITTNEKAEDKLTTRVYPVQNLIDDNRREESYTTLIRSIQLSTPGKWADQDGEGGELCAVPIAQALVIRQTQQQHRAIEGLLAALRKSAHVPRRPSIPADPDDPEELLFDEYVPPIPESDSDAKSAAE